MQIPLATYRLQLRPEFGFAKAADLVPYLSELGISHIYASPIFAARKGSMHGYDGVEPNALNDELGTPEQWTILVDRLRDHGMGWIQDIVPNHMAYHADNRMLADVFENGPLSRYCGCFDISWDHPLKPLRNKIMAPFLGAHYSDCLAKGDIRLVYRAGGFAARYGDLSFPLRIDTYLQVLDPPTASIKSALGENHPRYLQWVDALDSLESLAILKEPTLREDRIRSVKHTLWELYCDNTTVRKALSETLLRINGSPEDLGSFRLIDRLLSQQWFRLCFWKLANEEINYRRFFDINELIALRQESDAVFDRTHTLLCQLAADGIVNGVRVDHVDGLAHPGAYLHRLHKRLGEKPYVIVEKILDPDESLPFDWPVAGTTGYEFGHWINQLFVNPANAARFSQIYADFSGKGDTFGQVVYAAKRRVLARRFAGDLDNLARRVEEISAAKEFADYLTLTRIREALAEVLACFPVYRTYRDEGEIRPADRQAIETATSRAARNRPHLKSALDFLLSLLLEGFYMTATENGSDIRRRALAAIRRFQQLSSTLMAKGFEDTALYRYHRLISLNEVGGDPARFGCGIERFHQFMTERAAQRPHGLNATATHDSKRGEDVRARLNVLSEIPEEWADRIETWHRFTRDRRLNARQGPVPDRNTEYLLYQVLIGAWPRTGPVAGPFAERIAAYMIKAAREADVHTSWLEPNPEYETALTAFIDRILDPSPQNEFLPVFVPFCRKIAFFGLFNSLSQCLLKTAAPGVPDFYQGSEQLQLALVDPDNRRPVAYDRRRRLLAAISDRTTDSPEMVSELFDTLSDDQIKIFVITRALAARRQRRSLFQDGDYIPLKTDGRFRDSVIAFARKAGETWCLSIVPRFVTSLVNEERLPLGSDVWGDTTVIVPANAPRGWRNAFTHQETTAETGRELAVGELLHHFPVALLLGEDTP